MISPEEALQRFLGSTSECLELIDGVSREAWVIRPDGEEWSLAETIEHVVLSNQTTLALLRGTLFSKPRPADAERFPDDEITESMFRGPAPPGLAEPSGLFAAPEDGIEALASVRDAIAERVRAEASRLRDFAVRHPVFGPFDGVQWVLFGAAHTDNHLPQLRRLRQSNAPR
jgi:hypothetical protein